jgi:hypothetical protein
MYFIRKSKLDKVLNAFVLSVESSNASAISLSEALVKKSG